MKNNDESNYEIKLFTQILEDIGASKQATYVEDYLNHLGAKSYIIEKKYIDKDFIIDFSNFYSRSFDIDLKVTTRIHFFKEEISIDRFNSLIENYTETEFDEFNKLYLGFVIVRPITDFKGNPCLGRTLIETYPREPSGENVEEHRFYLTQNYNVSLFGLPLSIETLPFLPQDTAVGACATSACWVSLHPLHALFGIQRHSPYEITELAVTFPNLGRNFPSTGLSVLQMKGQFNSLGIETEFITIKKIKDSCPLYNKNDDVIADAVKAYNHAGLPIIATLKIGPKQIENSTELGASNQAKNNKQPEYHAVVISGYRYNNSGKVIEIYIHDDQVGPFHKVKPDNNFSKWINKWTVEGQHEFVEVDKLVVPIYPKMRLNFGLIYPQYIKIKRAMEETNVLFHTNADVGLFLTSLNNYRTCLLNYNFYNKLEILQTPMPRFLWIIRQRTNSQLSSDIIFDATAVYPKEICRIIYDINQKEIVPTC
jgi:hypothetical protein